MAQEKVSKVYAPVVDDDNRDHWSTSAATYHSQQHTAAVVRQKLRQFLTGANEVDVTTPKKGG